MQLVDAKTDIYSADTQTVNTTVFFLHFWMTILSAFVCEVKALAIF